MLTASEARQRRNESVLRLQKDICRTHVAERDITVQNARRSRSPFPPLVCLSVEPEQHDTESEDASGDESLADGMFVTPKDDEEDANDGCMHYAFSDICLIECCAWTENDHAPRVDALSSANCEIDVSLCSDAGLDLLEWCVGKENDIPLRVDDLCSANCKNDVSLCADVVLHPHE